VAAPALPGFLAALAPVLDRYGYLAVGGLILVEDFGVPAPGETILIAASVYAGAGRLNILLVVLVGFVGAVIGDNIGFAIGHFGGRPLAEKWGKYVLLTAARLDRAEGLLDRYGGRIVAVARFIEGLRQANGIIAGIARMPWIRFTAFNALGAAVWVGTWASMGYFAGNHITAIYQTVRHYEIYFFVLVAAVIVALIARYVIRRRRRARNPE
jgi:membrane protein DedA with SNARE-associated domain